jgi:hypothetical protein
MNFLKDGETGHLGFGEAHSLKLGGPHGDQAGHAPGLLEDRFGATGADAVQHGLNDLSVRQSLGAVEG